MSDYKGYRIRKGRVTAGLLYEILKPNLKMCNSTLEEMLYNKIIQFKILSQNFFFLISLESEKLKFLTREKLVKCYCRRNLYLFKIFHNINKFLVEKCKTGTIQLYGITIILFTIYINAHNNCCNNN